MTFWGGRRSRGFWPLAGFITLSLLGAEAKNSGAASAAGVGLSAGSGAGTAHTALTPATLPPGPRGGFTERAEDELLLFEVRLQGRTLSESFPGFPTKDGVLVPLGELCRLLGLAITTDPLTGRAQGFFISEKRTFNLDAGSNTVSVSGTVSPFNRAQVELHADDIYVDTRILSKWLPLNLEVDKLNSRLVVVPREPLPVMLQMARARGNAFSGSRVDTHRYAVIEDPYQWLETPMVDETLRASSNPPDSTPGSRRTAVVQSSTYASADFLKLSTNLYAYGDSQGERNLVATAGRRSPDGTLLGPLHATEFEFGEVFDPGLATVSGATTGTGLFVTNFPLNSNLFGDKQTLRGNLPPGWQVEVFQNGALIGFQASRGDGLYEFREIPLVHGWNDFRMVFYGPEGQRREEVQHLDNSTPLVPAGGFRYRLQAEELHGGLGGRGFFLGQYGLTDKVSIFAAGSTVHLTHGEVHHYATGGLQGRWNSLSFQGTVTHANEGGDAEEISVGTRLGDSLSITLKHTELQNEFISDLFLPSFGLVRNRTELELTGVAPSLAHPWLTLGVGLRRDGLASGGNVLQLNPRIGGAFNGWFLMNQFSYQRSDLPGGTTSSSYGSLLVSRFFGAFALRSEAAYTVAPDRHLKSVSTYFDAYRFKPWAVQIGLTHDIDSNENRFATAASKSVGRVGLSFDGSWSNRAGWSAGITVRMGLSREPRQGRWNSNALTVAPYGAISAQAFLDANSNGRRDQGEPSLPGAGAFVNGVVWPETSNADGVLYQHTIPVDMHAKVLLNPSTLPDPFMQAGGDGYTFVPRAGHITRFDLPVIQTADVNGTIYLGGPEGMKPYPGISIELLDSTGRVVASARSAFDGYYELQNFPTGKYQLRIKKEDLERRHLLPAEAKQMDLTGKHFERNGVDWHLRSAAVPEVIVAPPVPEPHGSRQ
ncbi:MAG: hypothetical protein IPP78_13520 [Holophagaceae bacterium]|nr:hypothetical protein [Holophagaceae bacterium]